MDSKKLDALLLAIECGSLTAAAEEMGYTQSGLTNMMNSLETELGLTLLSRSKNGVRLTQAGEALLPYMQAAQQETRRLEQAAAALRRHWAETLRLGEAQRGSSPGGGPSAALTAGAAGARQSPGQ